MKKIYLRNEFEVIKALKEGKEVFASTSPYTYKMVDGVICYYDTKSDNKLLGLNAFVGMEYAPYIEEEKHFTIEEEKFYKTRDGRKARCFFVSKSLNICRFTIDGLINVVETNKDGKQIVPGRFDDEMLPTDIVAYWEEK